MRPTGAAAILLTPDVSAAVACYADAFGFERQRHIDDRDGFWVCSGQAD